MTESTVTYAEATHEERIFVNGEFGVEPCRVTINHLPLSVEEALDLYQKLGRALERAGVKIRPR